MPVYVYQCEKCGAQVEKRQSFSDAPLTECESCHGPLHKVLQPTAIVFKGSGFYCTDSKSHSGASNGKNGSSKKDEPAKPAGDGSSSSDSSSTGDSSSSKKTTSTAAPSGTSA